MRYLLLISLFFSFSFADLQSKIYSNSQTACYLKNPTSGLSSSDYSPTVINQTLRQSFESIHTSTQSSATCDNWNFDPYVNVDVETYQVVANMDCTINQETITSGEYSTVYYWTVINQYALDVSCNSECEIPKDVDGNNYEVASYINEIDCSVSNLQTLLDTNNPDSVYVIDDAQYLDCPTSTSLTACYYKKYLNIDK